MDQQQEPDEYWMRCLVDGQQEALAVLVRRYANPLLTFIERMVGDRHRAEEVFQEVFLAVWTHRRRFDRTRRFRCWLFGIAANKCRAQCRRQAWRELLTGDAADCPPAEPVRVRIPVGGTVFT